MKQIYSLFALLAFCLVFATACSDDNEETAVQTLRVVSSNLEFENNGGTGTIEFTSTQPVTATSSADWCTATVQGNTVSVTVTENMRFESRSAMITLTNGVEETQVPVYQKGDILDTTMVESEYIFNAAGGDMSFRMLSNEEVTVTGADESWLTCTLENGTLTLHVEPFVNNMKYRTCDIRLSAGIHEKVYTITQMDTNLAGEWNCYKDNGKNSYGTCLIEAMEEANHYKVTPTGSVYDAPYEITVRGTEVVINFGQVLGPYEKDPTENIVLCAYDRTNGRLTWGTSVEMVAPIEFTEDGHIRLRWRDNGSWSGYVVEGFYYSITKNGTATGSSIGSAVGLIWESK